MLMAECKWYDDGICQLKSVESHIVYCDEKECKDRDLIALARMVAMNVAEALKKKKLNGFRK